MLSDIGIFLVHANDFFVVWNMQK